jgi:hypothetical protein
LDEKSVNPVFLVSKYLIVAVQNPAAEVVRTETSVSVQNGMLSKSIFTQIRILNRDGDRFNKISIPYSKMVKLSGVEACIKDGNGTLFIPDKLTPHSGQIDPP